MGGKASGPICCDWLKAVGEKPSQTPQEALDNYYIDVDE